MRMAAAGMAAAVEEGAEAGRAAEVVAFTAAGMVAAMVAVEHNFTAGIQAVAIMTVAGMQGAGMQVAGNIMRPLAIPADRPRRIPTQAPAIMPDHRTITAQPPARMAKPETPGRPRSTCRPT